MSKRPTTPSITKATETATGGAKTYKVGSTEKTRAATVKEVAAGLHTGYHIYEAENGTKYVRSNPDDTKNDNVDR